MLSNTNAALLPKIWLCVSFDSRILPPPENEFVVWLNLITETTPDEFSTIVPEFTIAPPRDNAVPFSTVMVPARPPAPDPAVTANVPPVMSSESVAPIASVAIVLPTDDTTAAPASVITASIPAEGTTAGLQFAAVLKLLSVPPIQAGSNPPPLATFPPPVDAGGGGGGADRPVASVEICPVP